MDHAAKQNQNFQVAPDRTTVNITRKTLLVALTAGIILLVNLLPLSRHQSAKMTVPQMVEAAAVQLTSDEAVTPPVESPAGTSPSPIRSSAETSGDELYQKGMYALINGQFQEAINSFAELQISNPEILDKIDLPYAEALLWRANDLRKSDLQQAITLYQKAIQLDPRSVRAYYQLGLAFSRQKDYASAIVSYQRAIEFNPQFPDIFFNLGFLYAASKNYAGAAEMYARTVAFKPDYLDEALFNLALAQKKLDKKEQSIANLKKALSVNPDNKAAQYYLNKLQGASEE